MTSSIDSIGEAARWSVPAPDATTAPGMSRDASTLRRISSSDVGQSIPMPRWAVSIASATPRPRFHRCGAERDRAVPVDVGVEPRVVVGGRIRHHMGGGVGDPVERPVCGFGKIAWRPGGVVFQPVIGAGQGKRCHRSYSAISSISIQRRSCQLCMAASASCRPLAPSRRFH